MEPDQELNTAKSGVFGGVLKRCAFEESANLNKGLCKKPNN